MENQRYYRGIKIKARFVLFLILVIGGAKRDRARSYRIARGLWSEKIRYASRHSLCPDCHRVPRGREEAGVGFREEGVTLEPQTGQPRIDCATLPRTLSGYWSRL